MNIAKKLVCLVLVCLFTFSAVCMASNEQVESTNATDTNDTYDEGSTSAPNSDYFVIDSDDVVVSDVINGNAFVFASNVTIEGTIYGDLFVVASTVTIEESASISNNVFVLASAFVMKGSAYGVYVYASSFELASSSFIYRDIRVYSSTVSLSGVINRDAYIVSDDLTIPEDSGILIGGNLDYTSSTECSVPDGAVLGEIKYTVVEEDTTTVADVIYTYVTSFITTIVYAIVVILLAAFYAPKFIEKANYVLTKRPFATAGIGILAIILIPIIAILILSFGIFTYISLAILAIYVLILSITLAIFSLAIGKYIVDKIKNPTKGKFILFSILSAIVLWILQIVPYIGGYITLFIFVVGLGVFLFAFFMRKDVSKIESKQE